MIWMRNKKKISFALLSGGLVTQAGQHLCFCMQYNATKSGFLATRHISLALNQALLSIIIPYRRQSKMLILSTNVDLKSLEKEFSIAICRPIGECTGFHMGPIWVSPCAGCPDWSHITIP